MNSQSQASYTAFEGYRRIARGSLASVALAFKRAMARDPADAVLIFDDSAGRPIDIDVRGTEKEVLARFGQRPGKQHGEPDGAADHGKRRGRGRPRLGVVSREVTLLPRHWHWLAAQPGGASVALRELVETARRTRADEDRSREANERACHFISAIAGDLPGFEEACRALFARERVRFGKLIAAWPADVRDHAMLLAFGAAPD